MELKLEEWGAVAKVEVDAGNGWPVGRSEDATAAEAAADEGWALVWDAPQSGEWSFAVGANGAVYAIGTDGMGTAAFAVRAGR